MMRTLLSCISACCLLAIGSSHAQLLDGADVLLAEDMSFATVSPAVPQVSSTRGMFGLDSWLSFRNDRLSLSSWNDHAGHFLDDEEKRQILDEVGGTFVGWERLNLRPFQMMIPLGDKAASTIGLSLELVSQGLLRIDGKLLDLAFFGNDPYETIQIEHAELGAELNLQLRGVWSRQVTLPASLPGWLAGRTLRVGAGLMLERLGLRTETIRFDNEVAPLVGSIAAEFHHTQELADTGLGQAIDLGVGAELELLGRPLLVDAAVRSLLHTQRWSHVRHRETVFQVPETGISSEFDESLFTDQLVDSSYTVSVGARRIRRNPGWALGLRWLQSASFQHALLLEQLPESAVPGRQQRIAWYSRWKPRGGIFHLGAEIAGGMGRGPSLGADLQVRWRMVDVGLSAKGYAGLGNRSRGSTTGVMTRIRF